MSRCSRIAPSVVRNLAGRSASLTKQRCTPVLTLVRSFSTITLTAQSQPGGCTLLPLVSKRDFHATRSALAGGSGGPKVNSDGSTSFLLTDIGEGIAECEILKWFVKVGDHVEEFDKLVEVQSDKANVVIPSRYSGVITKVYAPEGEMIKVGAPLIDIKVEGDGGQEKPEAAPTSAPSSPSRPQGSVDDSVSDFHTITTSRGPVKIGATPAVRRIARELGINLSEVSGSGKDGRVTKDDIQRFATEGRKPKAQQTTTLAATSSTPTPAVSCPLQFVGGVRREAIRGIRRAMVKTMTATTAVPHLGYCDEITMDALMQLRDELRTIGEKRGTKITYMPFILKATSLALKAYPILNSSVSEDGNELLYKESHNIGIAMDTPQGLIVPNIKNCQLLSVFEIAQELNRLQKLGAEGKLSTADLTGGTFTLSNIGAIGGTYASPVLVLPEVVIGALGKIQTLPRFGKGSTTQVVATKLMQVSWSADHRVIDGASIASFSNLWKRYLENPAAMVLELK